MESDAQIYTIAVGEPRSSTAKPMELMEEKRGLLFLDELAAKTGGMSFMVHARRTSQRRPPTSVRRFAINTPSDMRPAATAAMASGARSGSKSRARE